MLKKVFKWIGIVVLALAVCVALFYAVENVRGKCAWERYVRECAEQGMTLDWQAFIPPPVPDDENIAMMPIFRDLLAIPRNKRIWLPSPPRSQTSTNNTVSGSIWQTGRYAGLDHWRVALSNDNLLAALSVYDDDLREVEEALERPSFRSEGWDDAVITDPYPDLHLGVTILLARMYTLRALAKYEAGQYDGMTEDIQTGFRMVNCCQKASPVIVSALVSSQMFQMLCTPLWCGISGRMWDERQLVTLQNMLAEINLVEHTVRAVQFERAWFSSQTLSASPSPADVYNAMLMRKTPVWFYMIPRGWFYQNAVLLAEHIGQPERMLHADERCFDIAQLKHIEAPKHYPRFITLDPFPLVDVSIQRVAQAQATLHQAVIACAIERYRLEHGRIPETLDGLVPQLLAKIPCDPCDGQPMRYKPEGDGGPLLYSIGWNGTDDGGQPGVKKKSGIDTVDIDSGDWIWRLAPAEESEIRNSELQTTNEERHASPSTLTESLLSLPRFRISI
ncbi:MAG: hypothetical protein FWG50_07310 [Kiritimatiellaeota bacterium]|nr:hypothetical protein [Kiritimatiellota bacterium]